MKSSVCIFLALIVASAILTEEVSGQNICNLPVEVGPCRARMIRYHYNGDKCDVFYYGGCRGNENNFRTKGECERSCVTRRN